MASSKAAKKGAASRAGPSPSAKSAPRGPAGPGSTDGPNGPSRRQALLAALLAPLAMLVVLLLVAMSTSSLDQSSDAAGAKPGKVSVQQSVFLALAGAGAVAAVVGLFLRPWPGDLVALGGLWFGVVAAFYDPGASDWWTGAALAPVALLVLTTRTGTATRLSAGVAFMAAGWILFNGLVGKGFGNFHIAWTILGLLLLCLTLAPGSRARRNAAWVGVAAGALGVLAGLVALLMGPTVDRGILVGASALLFVVFWMLLRSQALAGVRMPSLLPGRAQAAGP
jgi:hypothetical protein